MFIKIILIILSLNTLTYASFEKIKIGKIDNYYKNKINEQEIRNILNEIEYIFESQLNINVFDYSEEGKVIDIIYIPPSKLEQRIVNKTEKIKLKKENVEKIQASLPKKLKKINIEKKFIKEESSILNRKIKNLNEYIKEVNKQKRFSKNEYTRVKTYIKNEQKKLKLFQAPLIGTNENYNQK